MADNMNIVRARMKSKYDTLENWIQSARGDNPFIPFQGEICVVEIPSTATIVDTQEENQSQMAPPAIAMKVGDGEHTFIQLPWLQGVAGDIYAWAKQPSIVNSYTEEALRDLVSDAVGDTNTKYKIVRGTIVDTETGETIETNQYFLYKKDFTDDDFVPANTTNNSQQEAIPFLDLTSLIESVGTGIQGLGTTSANANEVLISVGVENGQLVSTSTTITNDFIQSIDVSSKATGILSVEHGGTGRDTLASGQVLIGNGTGAINTKGIDTTVSTDSDNLITSGAVATAIDDILSSLTSSMHFIGTATVSITNNSTNDPEISGYDFSKKQKGDVILYGNKEFAWDGSKWIELGDEGSYALKTIEITAADGLTGGGTLSENRSISHAIPTGASTTPIGTDGNYVKTITTDKFGHVINSITEALPTYTLTQDTTDKHKITFQQTGKTEKTEITIPDNDTIYTFAEGNTDGAFSVTPSDGAAQSIPIHGLAAAAYKDVDESIPSDSTTATNNKVPTTAAVTTAIKNMSIYKLQEGSKTTATGNIQYLVFDCGTATTLID